MTYEVWFSIIVFRGQTKYAIMNIQSTLVNYAKERITLATRSLTFQDTNIVFYIGAIKSSIPLLKVEMKVTYINSFIFRDH